MDQSEKDRIAAEIAADYRSKIRETADTERNSRPGRARSTGEKSMGLAYLLWFFFGGIGGHRFYLGHPLSATGMLILSVFTMLFSLVPLLNILSFPFVVMLFLWWLVDAFLIPRMMPRQY